MKIAYRIEKVDELTDMMDRYPSSTPHSKGTPMTQKKTGNLSCLEEITSITFTKSTLTVHWHL